MLGMLLAVAPAAQATTLTTVITDQDGRPVMNAVVMLIPESMTAMPKASARLDAEKFIDQRNETFIPLVTIVPKGGHIVFANNDKTTHQVYSFSEAKQFEITLAHGEKSSPIVFGTTGVAALGCNIHDHMIAYAFVTDSPWTGLTSDDGTTVIDDVPPGNYQAKIWHPKFPPGREAPTLHVSLSGDTARLTAKVRVLSPPITHKHTGSY